MEMRVHYSERDVDSITTREYFCDLKLPEGKFPKLDWRSFLYLSGMNSKEPHEVLLRYHSIKNTNIIRYKIKDEKEYNLIKKILEGIDHSHRVHYKTPNTPYNRDFCTRFYY